MPASLPENMTAPTTNDLQPYDFLGLTDAATLTDLRKAYYKMALACHPDKGGSHDAMRILQACVEFIKIQLTDVAERATTFEAFNEAREKEYEAAEAEGKRLREAPPRLQELLFSVAQSHLQSPRFQEAAVAAEVPWERAQKFAEPVFWNVWKLRPHITHVHRDVEADLAWLDTDAFWHAMTHELKAFDEFMVAMPETGLWPAAVPHGYGAQMDASAVRIPGEHEHIRAEAPLTADRDAELTQPLAHMPPMQQDVVIYDEPNVAPSRTHAVSLVVPEKENTYTLDTPFPMSDYMEAFQTAPSLYDASCDPTDSVATMYEEAVKNRDAMLAEIRKKYGPSQIEMRHDDGMLSYSDGDNARPTRQSQSFGINATSLHTS